MPTLMVWAFLGVGVVTLLWTVLALGRPDWLHHPVTDWLKPSSTGLSGKWATELDNVVSTLDPRLNFRNLRPPSRVCPEVHKGGRFVRKSCDFAPKISELMTVILPAQGWAKDRILQVLDGFHRHSEMSIILILDDDLLPPHTNVTVLLTNEKGESEGRLLNSAVSMVNTSFVLVGENLVYYSKHHTSLDRLIQVMDQQPSVAVAGGGYRDVQGQWRHGCIQRSITNFHATFIRGYEYSHQECMYCDDVIGPFVVHTQLLRDEPFNEEVSKSMIYHDWFTTIINAGYLVMVCPDVMFFTEEELTLDVSDWKEYGRQWSVVSIDSYDHNQYRFSCREVHINCNDLQKRISWYLIPPCCRETIMKGIALVDQFSKEKKVDYEMHHGSLLGAIKLGSYLPWDFDQDIYYDCRDKPIWQSMNRFFKSKKANCYLRLSNTQTQLVIQCKTFFIDMVCRKPLTRFALPDIYSNISTWIDYGGHNVSIMANPGAAARDQGGSENLRHAQHWRVKNHPDPGAWRPCSSSHISCLDRHPADGNFAFANPPVCLP